MMNEVYLIWSGRDFKEDVDAVLSTREKADQYLDAFKKTHLEEVAEDKIGRSFRAVELKSGYFMMWDVRIVDYNAYDGFGTDPHLPAKSG